MWNISSGFNMEKLTYDYFWLMPAILAIFLFFVDHPIPLECCCI